MAKGRPTGRPTGRPEKYTVEQMITALRRENGLVYRAAKRLRCSPRTIYVYKEKYPEIAEVTEQERELLLDDAEHGLAEQVRNSEQWAIVYVLNTLGKKRGYGTKSEIEHTHNFGSIEVPATADPDDWEAIANAQLKERDDSVND